MWEKEACVEASVRSKTGEDGRGFIDLKEKREEGRR